MAQPLWGEAGAPQDRPTAPGRGPGRGCLLAVVALLVLWAGASALGSGARPAPVNQPPVSGTVRVTYQLTGSARAADLTYTDASGNIQQMGNIGVPMRPSIDFGAPSGSFVQFSAQNAGEGGALDCAILADGVTVNTGHSSGGYAIVSCSARLP